MFLFIEFYSCFTDTISLLTFGAQAGHHALWASVSTSTTWSHNHCPVTPCCSSYYCGIATTTKLSGTKQPFYYAQRFCWSGIQPGHCSVTSGASAGRLQGWGWLDSWAWNHLGVMLPCLELDAGCQLGTQGYWQKHTNMTLPCGLGFFRTRRLASKDECQSREPGSVVSPFRIEVRSHIASLLL